MTVQRAVFQAKWDPSILHLKSNVSPSVEKARSIFFQVITLGLSKWLGNVAKQAILPSAFAAPFTKTFHKNNFEHFWHGPINRHNQKLRSYFKAEPYTVITPDGAELETSFFRHRDANPKTPTLIYFQPNGCISTEEVHQWLLKESIHRGVTFNFAIFDYRSVGGSKGIFKSTDDLRLDGASIVQWIRDKIGTPADQIHFYGYSLGGAFSIKTKALYPDQLTGRIVNERSLSSIDEVVKSFLPPRLKCLAGLVSWILRMLGYSLDAASDFQKLQGKKLVVYHPKDPVISYEASLHRHTQGVGHQSHKLEYAYISSTRPNHHCAPLKMYAEAREEISRFVFNL